MENFFYKRIIRKLAFILEAEKAHNIALKSFKILSNSNLIKSLIKKKFNIEKPLKIFGINFKNPIGLAAGFDKNGEVYDFIECLGFGFIEIGSVTLKPQKGNPKPRLWRVIEEEGIINHFGLNNYGAYEILKNIERKGKPQIPLGINITKNNDVDFEDMDKNIFECFKILKDCGDFFVINISCPNVKQIKIDIPEYVKRIIERIKSLDEIKPLFIKISPDMKETEIKEITMLCEKTNCGIVATNTTKRKDTLKTREFDNINGGVSGKPLSSLSIKALKIIRETSKNIPVISVGGIFTYEEVKERKELGADLFEIYTSFIYEGPSIVSRLCK